MKQAKRAASSRFAILRYTQPNQKEVSVLKNPFIFYSADCRGKEDNCRYPNRHEVMTVDQFREVVGKDYVCAEYAGSYRKGDNFRFSNVVAMDNDNDHTDIADQWVTPSDIASMLPGVPFLVHYSRHHMKPKEGRSSRPRFHIAFLIDDCTDSKAYADIKKRLHEHFPFFDQKALDAARFFYGTENPQVEMHDGNVMLNKLLDALDAEEAAAEEFLLHRHPKPIPAGSRNSTMSNFAGRVLIRLGDTDEARRAFDDRANSCTPPLDDAELEKIWRSALRFYAAVSQREGYIKPEDYNKPTVTGWEEPIPFGKYTLSAFPVDALPAPIADYVRALSESTQTPIDMAGAGAISMLSTCMQGKFRIRGKADWVEPVNTYLLEIAPPSERKSAVQHALVKPVSDYEIQYNREHAACVEGSRMHKRILERKQKAIEEQVAKGKAEASELESIAAEITSYREQKPLRLFADDITPEKLVSVLSENDGRMALISSEAGIFDTLAGAYSKSVNIDVMLKGYSGDYIRVDRIGRESESIMDPALTVLLMAQPSVISEVLSNGTFRGRGLTARFLYSFPASTVGSRQYRSEPVSENIYRAYERCIYNLLEDEYSEDPEIITLSPEADEMLAAFAEELEPKLVGDYVEIADWCGKLVGNTLRIAGLLCRASVYREHEFLDEYSALVVDGATMGNAIRIGKYFLNHAQAVFSVLPENESCKKAARILDMLKDTGLAEFNRRDAMRYIRTFKKAADIQPVLDFLEDYGYIIQINAQPTFGKGRPPLPQYLVNPWVHEHYCPFVPVSSQGTEDK